MKRQHIVFGPRGMMGSAMLRGLRDRYPDDLVYEVARGTPSPMEVDAPSTDIFARIDSNRATYAYWCHGPTDPSAPAPVHRRFSVELPGAWAAVLGQGMLARFVTFGSVHENLPNLAAGNSYLSAKREWFLNLAGRPRHFRHFQIHTLYGAPLRPTSFVGQIFASLRDTTEFRMSHGRQLREYHHVDDCVAKVHETMNIELPGGNNFIDLSHGRPIRLADLAQGVFRNFGVENRLHISAVGARTEEILECDWVATAPPFLPIYRDPILGVSQVIESSLKKR